VLDELKGDSMSMMKTIFATTAAVMMLGGCTTSETKPQAVVQPSKSSASPKADAAVTPKTEVVEKSKDSTSSKPEKSAVKAGEPAKVATGKEAQPAEKSKVAPTKAVQDVTKMSQTAPKAQLKDKKVGTTLATTKAEADSKDESKTDAKHEGKAESKNSK
jgi:hypothetical protein